MRIPPNLQSQISGLRGCLLLLAALMGFIALGWVVIFFAMQWLEGLPKPKRDMSDLKVAYNHYRTEYGAWPDIESLHHSESTPIQLRGNLLNALLGDVSKFNPRGIKFVEFRHASKGISGLADEGETLALHDAWGCCYWVMIDANGDNRIPNPELFPGAVCDPRIRMRSQEFLSASCVLFSSGPDRDPKTWTDNSVSW
jgi:hypothetical protein